MREVTVGFSKPRGKILPIFSWIIRLFQGTEYSHVYVKHMTKYGLEIIYQASGAQVNFVSGAIFNDKNVVLREFYFSIHDVTFDNYMKYCIKNAGKPYSLMQALGILVKDFLKLDYNPFSDGKSSYVCSELVGEILADMSGVILSEQNLDLLTPRDIYNTCINLRVKGGLL